jgi:hypothetical protein
MEDGGNYVQNLFARVVDVIQIVGTMCSSVFHFAIVVTVVEEDIMTLQVMKL